MTLRAPGKIASPASQRASASGSAQAASRAAISSSDRVGAPADAPWTLGERWARLRHELVHRLGLKSLNIEPKEPAGLTPRLDAEVADPFTS